MAKFGSVSEKYLTDESLRGIGVVAAEFGYLESGLELLITVLGGVNSMAADCIITHLTPSTKIEIAQTLTRSLVAKEPLRTEILACIAEFDRIRVERNNLIHGCWINANGRSMSFKITARGTTRMNFQLLVPEELKKLISSMVSLEVAMRALAKKIPPPPAEPTKEFFRPKSGKFLIVGPIPKPAPQPDPKDSD